MDPYASQRQSNLRMLESFQHAQQEILRLQSILNTKENTHSHLKIEHLSNLKKEVGVLKKSNEDLKSFAVVSYLKMKKLLEEKHVVLLETSKIEKAAMDDLKIKLNRSEESEMELRKENMKYKKQLEEMTDYQVMKTESRKSMSELTKLKKSSADLFEEKGRIHATMEDLKQENKSLLNDLSHMKNLKEKLFASEARLRSAEELIQSNEAVFTQKIETLTQLYEQKLFLQGEVQTASRVRIAELEKERARLLDTLQTGQRFAQFVELKTENAQLHARISELVSNSGNPLVNSKDQKERDRASRTIKSGLSVPLKSIPIGERRRRSADGTQDDEKRGYRPAAIVAVKQLSLQAGASVILQQDQPQVIRATRPREGGFAEPAGLLTTAFAESGQDSTAGHRPISSVHGVAIAQGDGKPKRKSPYREGSSEALTSSRVHNVTLSEQFPDINDEEDDDIPVAAVDGSGPVESMPRSVSYSRSGTVTINSENTHGKFLLSSVTR